MTWLFPTRRANGCPPGGIARTAMASRFPPARIAGWKSSPEDGSGHVCYAQWEDVGPLRYDHAEYVFGDERPDTYTRAGLDVSPAVAKYLGIDEDKKALTRWRFVDDEDVPPGVWLKYDEQALLYRALQQLQELQSPSQRPTYRSKGKRSRLTTRRTLTRTRKKSARRRVDANESGTCSAERRVLTAQSNSVDP